MTRHTTFRYCLDPTGEQQIMLARHAGAARFAFNQCLRLHLQARADQRRDGAVVVPWTGFDFINAFNTWKKTAQAGRIIIVDSGGEAEVKVTGLPWRSSVCQQVFEEAAVDLSKAMRAWTDSRRGKRTGRRVGHPRFKKKDRGIESFRLRNKHRKRGRPAIRVGDAYRRSVTLPGIGTVRVHDDTRRLRRLIAKGRGQVLFATVSCRAGRWWVSLNVEAADLHASHHHAPRADDDSGGWVGVDRGLSALVVAATSDGHTLARITNPPKALTSRMRRQRRLARALSRKQKGSKNRRQAAARLGQHHHLIANVRKHFLHQVTGDLVKTHDRLVIEDLNVTGMLANHRLARAISDAGWTEFARQLGYKQDWRRGELLLADRWFASSKTCSTCGTVRASLGLGERTYHCAACGLIIDRDVNAAINLATWAEQHHGADARAGTPKQEARSPTPTDRNALAAALVTVKRTRMTWEPTSRRQPPSEPTTPEKGGAERSPRLFDTL